MDGDRVNRRLVNGDRGANTVFAALHGLGVDALFPKCLCDQEANTHQTTQTNHALANPEGRELSHVVGRFKRRQEGERNPYPGKLGVVEEGALADLILVNGNPLENLDLVADPEKNFVVIMKDGKIYRNTTQ